MIHILHVLMVGFTHIHNARHLYAFYVHHHAIRFLLSGITSEAPDNAHQAVALLHWLTFVVKLSPVDW